MSDVAVVSNNTVVEYDLDRSTELEIPEGAVLLSCGSQDDQCVLWALVDPNAKKVKRHFITIETNTKVPQSYLDYGGYLEYVDTIKMEESDVVFHVFQTF